MKKLLLAITVLVFTGVTQAQQDPQFSMNTFNRLFPNPGVAGSNNAICANLMARQQWMGFDGRPNTYLLSAHGPVSILHGGVGGSIFSDQIGQEKTFGFKLAYAYRRAIGVGTLGAGLGFGMVNKTLLSGWVSNDPVNQDAAIPNNGGSDMGFDMDFGLYYKTPTMFVGLSTTHLTQSELEDVTAELSYKVARHYYILAGYVYSFNSMPQLQLQPSVYIKSDGASTIFDVNLLAIYNNQFWGGVSYRVQDAVVPMVGIKQPVGNGTLKFGYSYDVTTSILKQYSSGTHEIMLGYCFNLPDDSDVQKHKTVRFL